MQDKYPNFAALAAAESPDAYAITLRDTGSPIVVAALHGGGIEPGTSEIALAIAKDQYSHYLFEGIRKHSNRDLHIPSVNFDEPSCLSLLRSARMVVTVHGEEDPSPIVYLGGLHEAAIHTVRSVLESAGFDVRHHPNAHLKGEDKRNVCNIGSCGGGLQLELSRGLRKSFFTSLSANGRRTSTPELSRFAGLVHEALRRTRL